MLSAGGDPKPEQEVGWDDPSAVWDGGSPWQGSGSPSGASTAAQALYK